MICQFVLRMLPAILQIGSFVPDSFDSIGLAGAANGAAQFMGNPIR